MWAACSVFLSSPQRWIYEARGLIHNQIMWAWDSWTTLLSIFLTQGKKTARETFLFFHHYKCWVLSGSQIIQRDSVSVRTTCWALNLTSEETISQLWSLHNCQQMMVLKGLRESFSFSVCIVCNNSLWLISLFKKNQTTTATKGCSISCFSRYLKTKAGLTCLNDIMFKYLWLSKEGILALLWPPPALLLYSMS